jgi:sugar/nucleoside kinase (ribokinase family)
MDRPLDLVGLGAVNRDFIVRWQDLDAEEQPALRRLLDLERTTKNLDAFAALLSRFLPAASQVARSYGGSALNVARAVARLSPQLRIGYVSAIGPIPIGEEGALWPALRDAVNEVDLTEVRTSEAPTGACLSLVDDHGTRELLTYYSDAVADRLAEPAVQDAVVAYLSQARHIHVSSVLGNGGPAAVLRILERVLAPGRTSAPPTLSVDPGLPWAELVSAGVGDEVLEIVRLADQIFVNTEELKRLGETSDVEDAARNLAGGGRTTSVVLLKDWDRTVIVREDGSTDLVPLSALPPSRIADSTGGGDVFAAGFLAASLNDRVGEVANALTGMMAARTKLQAFGDDGYDRLRDTFSKDHESSGGVFVSYEESDLPLAQALVSLLESTGVSIARIFCINIEGAGVPRGEEWLPAVAYRLQRADLVVSLVTPPFLSSDFCAYEAGAAWILSKQNWCLVHRDVDMSELGPLRAHAQATWLDDMDGVRRLREHITRIGCAPPFVDWSRPYAAFLAAIATYRQDQS